MTSQIKRELSQRLNDYKSYLVEKNINILKNRIALFYGENLGIQKDFKNIITKHNSNSEVVKFDQEDIMKILTFCLMKF